MIEQAVTLIRSMLAWENGHSMGALARAVERGSLVDIGRRHALVK